MNVLGHHVLFEGRWQGQALQQRIFNCSLQIASTDGRVYHTAACDGNGEKVACPPLFPPFVESVSGDDTAATADEMLECRLLRQGFGTGVNHPVSD